MAVAAALSGFALLLVGSMELSLLDNAQAVCDMLAVVALGALLALAAGTDVIAGEREHGSLLPVLLAPVSRSGLLGKIGGQAVAWTVTLAIVLPYPWAACSTGQNLLGGGIALLLLGTPVALGFGFLALGLGARLGSPRAHVEGGLHDGPVPAHLPPVVHALGHDFIRCAFHERGWKRRVTPMRTEHIILL